MKTNNIPDLLTDPKPMKRISIIKTIIVKEASMLYGARRINTPALAAGLAKDFYQNADREMLIVASLDSKCAPLSIEIVAIGNINSCIVSPREVFKHAIISNAVHIIAFHNHVSGECTPSSEDIAITKRLIEAGELLGIPLLDHIIIGGGDSYLSLREDEVVSFITKVQNYTKE
jgi:DNA repair protein RadC